MASEVKLPRLGQGMESGTIVKWLKSEGEEVKKGEPLYELDTDKVTQEVEAEASGVLLKIAVSEGEVEVGRTIAFIGEAGEEVAAADGSSSNGAAAREVEEQPQEEGSRAPARDAERERGREAAAQPEPPPSDKLSQSRSNGRVKASPLARRIARERGIDIARVRGTGPEGRVIAEDVEKAGAQPAPAAAAVPVGEVEQRPLTSIRKTIARRLTQAWEVPVFQLLTSVDMTRVNELLARLRDVRPEPKVTVTDVLTKASAAALMQHRDVNVQYTEDAILVFPTANIGIAVAAPQGLVVPVIRSAERKTLHEIAEERAALVDRARNGKLQQADLEDGTFTISNLGMFQVERFTAVLNPPQAAIVAVGATEEKPVVVDGEIAIRPMLTLSGTYDHRAVDGAPAAAFLQSLKMLLEEPGLML